MPDQLQLLPEKAPSIDPGEIALLESILDGAGWLTATELAGLNQLKSLFVPSPISADSLEATKRRIRAIANASGGRILSYPGSKGYKLTRQATVDEINTATAKLRHQAGEMHQRALEIDRVYHGKKR